MLKNDEMRFVSLGDVASATLNLHPLAGPNLNCMRTDDLE